MPGRRYSEDTDGRLNEGLGDSLDVDRHPVLAQPRRQQRKQWAYHARREPDILTYQYTKVVAPLKVLFPPPDVEAERSQACRCPACHQESPDNTGA